MTNKEAYEIAKKAEKEIYEKACQPIFKVIKEAAEKGEFSIEYPLSKTELNPYSYLLCTCKFFVTIREAAKEKPRRLYIDWSESKEEYFQ